MKAIIHATRLSWQERYFKFFKQGFERHGIKVERSKTDSPENGDIHVLFGPNYWKECEKIYTDYLFVNRKFIGNVHDDIAVSWNGFNGYGIFNVDATGPRRKGVLAKFIKKSPIEIAPMDKPINWAPKSFLLLGQADTGRSDQWRDLSSWHKKMRNEYRFAHPVFRPWPTGDGHTLQQDVARTEFSVSMNSTVSVETLMLGHKTVVWCKGSPVYSMCRAGAPFNDISERRMVVLEYLANCQYDYMEIQNGVFWDFLGPGPIGKRLWEIDFESI